MEDVLVKEKVKERRRRKEKYTAVNPTVRRSDLFFPLLFSFFSDHVTKG